MKDIKLAGNTVSMRDIATCSEISDARLKLPNAELPVNMRASRSMSMSKTRGTLEPQSPPNPVCMLPCCHSDLAPKCSLAEPHLSCSEVQLVCVCALVHGIAGASLRGGSLSTGVSLITDIAGAHEPRELCLAAPQPVPDLLGALAVCAEVSLTLFQAELLFVYACGDYITA